MTNEPYIQKIFEFKYNFFNYNNFEFFKNLKARLYYIIFIKKQDKFILLFQGKLNFLNSLQISIQIYT